MCSVQNTINPPITYHPQVEHVELQGLLQATSLPVRVPVHPKGVEEGGHGAAARPPVLPDGPAQPAALENDNGEPDDPRQSHIQRQKADV